jgi:hypothetical protein
MVGQILCVEQDVSVRKSRESLAEFRPKLRVLDALRAAPDTAGRLRYLPIAGRAG